MNHRIQFPTPLHQQIAENACRFFEVQSAVDSVLVVNSISRGQAVAGSDLDMAVLVLPGTPADEVARLEAEWGEGLTIHHVLKSAQAAGQIIHVHLDVIRGQYVPETWDDGGGPDGFELEIGNQLAYGAPMREAGPYYRSLQAEWLPYYHEDLRQQRLAMVRAACAYDLEQVPFFVRRELYFQAFDRLYKGFQEFLQALFISRRVYPLAYNKWIRLQVAEWLGLPQLYLALPPLISISSIESSELIERAGDLKDLLERWTVDQPPPADRP